MHTARFAMVVVCVCVCGRGGGGGGGGGWGREKDQRIASEMERGEEKEERERGGTWGSTSCYVYTHTSQMIVSTHVIRDISYCSQDIEDKRVFAYITKDKSGMNYCHVFMAASEVST